jgi:hypothetical protein
MNYFRLPVPRAIKKRIKPEPFVIVIKFISLCDIDVPILMGGDLKNQIVSLNDTKKVDRIMTEGDYYLSFVCAGKSMKIVLFKKFSKFSALNE